MTVGYFNTPAHHVPSWIQCGYGNIFIFIFDHLIRRRGTDYLEILPQDSNREIGRIASEEVTLQLLYSKCVPVLLYGLEACPLNISDFRSLDFVIDRFFMRLFKTNNINTVRFCQIQFGYQLPSVIIQSRTDSFLNKI